ncbi:mobile element-associated protein [Staphylococcus succinus]|nr:mobile element-associated protein [Staphylococcus succinus]
MRFEKIQLNYNTDISIVEYQNLDSGSFIQFTECTWNELVNRLQIPKISQNKYSRNTALYGDVIDGIDKYGNQKQKYREDKNIIYRNVIVLDYDDISDLKALHNSIREQLSNVSWFWHTTFSHTTDTPRIRLLVPLDESINAEEYRICSKVVANKIGHKVDEGSYQPSRCMALPVIKHKDAIYIYQYNDAPILNKSILAEWYKNVGVDSKNNIKLKFNKRDDEYWKSISYGVTTGSRNNALTSIIGHLFNKGVNDHLIYGLAYNYGKMCQPPISDKEINTTFQSIFKKHYKL